MLEENFLKVSDIHNLYYVTTGNKKGIPLIFVHGGPGSSSNILKNIDGIDLDKFYCIAYDQRGCGKSKPSGEIRENTTQDAIEDIIKLMNHLNIKKSLFSGGSWGAGLLLLFAISHPERVEKMFLKSTFAIRKGDLDWFFNGSKIIYPDLYEKYILPLISNPKINRNENSDIAKFLLNELENSTIKEKQKITCHINNYDYALMNMVFSNTSLREPSQFNDIDINSMKIYLHFEANNYFIEDNYIFKNIDGIKNIPINFYHGRFDMNCTMDGAYKLHKLLPKSKLVIVPYESHKGVLMNELRTNDINCY